MIGTLGKNTSQSNPMNSSNIHDKSSLIDYINHTLNQENAAQQRLKYLCFWGHQPSKDGNITTTCFSQWFEASFTIDGVHYPTAEHYMMAEKARLLADRLTLQKILAVQHPHAAKELGREVQGFQPSLWEAHRFDIVVQGNLAKFSQNSSLGEFLLHTGDRILVEASPVDKIWGTGLAADNPDAENPDHWPGLNLLGFALMEVRNQLLSQD
jgi:ribA/ribD-fused uncharacterized protein